MTAQVAQAEETKKQVGIVVTLMAGGWPNYDCVFMITHSSTSPCMHLSIKLVTPHNPNDYIHLGHGCTAVKPSQGEVSECSQGGQIQDGEQVPGGQGDRVAETAREASFHPSNHGEAGGGLSRE